MFAWCPLSPSPIQLVKVSAPVVCLWQCISSHGLQMQQFNWPMEFAPLLPCKSLQPYPSPSLINMSPLPGRASSTSAAPRTSSWHASSWTTPFEVSHCRWGRGRAPCSFCVVVCVIAFHAAVGAHTCHAAFSVGPVLLPCSLHLALGPPLV